MYYCIIHTRSHTHRGQRKDRRWKRSTRGEDIAGRQICDIYSHTGTYVCVCMHLCGHMLKCTLRVYTVYVRACLILRVYQDMGSSPSAGRVCFQLVSLSALFLPHAALSPTQMTDGGFTGCSELSSASRCSRGSSGPNQKPAISQGHLETSKASSD